MLVIAAIVLMVAADQAVKLWAIQILKPVGTIPIWEGVFHLTYIENRGAAFSILQNQQWLFIISTAVILVIIGYLLYKKMIRTRMLRWALYMLMGGAIGNWIDRIFRSYVVDLFDFRLIHFPVFNIADIFVTIGGILFVYILMRHETKEDGEDSKNA